MRRFCFVGRVWRPGPRRGRPQSFFTLTGSRPLLLDSKLPSMATCPRAFSEPSYSFVSAHLLAFVHSY